MAPRPFVHLHLHTQYSLLDGAIKHNPLFERAKALGMPAPSQRVGSSASSAVANACSQRRSCSAWSSASLSSKRR